MQALLFSLAVAGLSTLLAAGGEEQAPAAPTALAGEILPKSAIGPGVIESMDVVLERQKQLPPPELQYPKARNGQQGTWEVPSRRWTLFPHSGEHYAVAQWGDTSMGIGFGGEVALEGVWISGHMERGAWTNGVRAVGFKDGAEVARTEWFEDVDGVPSWFAIDFASVDRVVLEAQPVYEGAGFYGIDDLTFTRAGESAVVDFEDLTWRDKLTGSGHAGLTWETGAGDFSKASGEVHGPLVPPGHVEASGPEPKGLANAGGIDAATAPILLASFTGPKQSDPGGGWVPPDTHGAVGTNHFVAVVNQHMSVYDKTTGNRLISTSLQGFFGGGGSKGDPRVVFDQYNGRWIVIASDFSSGIRLAVSLTDDATGSWFKTFINLAQGSDSGSWPDYPTLGYDANGIYVGAYMVGNNFLMSLFAIDSAPLYQATPSVGTVAAWRQLPWEGALQACSTYGPGAAGCYVISRQDFNTQRLRVVSPPMTAPTMTQVGFVQTKNGNSPPSAPAQGSTFNLSTVGPRPMNAAYRNGSVWMAHCVDKAGRAAINWYEIDAATAALVQEGTVKDSVMSFSFPTIAANANGDAVIGFSASSPSLYAGCWYTGRAASDPLGEMAPPAEYRAGGGAYNQSGGGTNRWGDYSNTSIDPGDDLSFWTIQEYAKSNGDWGTNFAKIEVPAPTCGTAINYCTPGTSTNGCQGTVVASGTPSASAPSGFTLTAMGIEGNKDAIFFWGINGQQANPWGSSSSFQCVVPPAIRGGLLTITGTSGQCDGAPSQDLNALWCSTCPNPAKNPGAGAIVDAQCWYRDPFSTSNQTTALSDGIEFAVCP